MEQDQFRPEWTWTRWLAGGKRTTLPSLGGQVCFCPVSSLLRPRSSHDGGHSPKIPARIFSFFLSFLFHFSFLSTFLFFSVCLSFFLSTFLSFFSSLSFCLSFLFVCFFFLWKFRLIFMSSFCLPNLRRREVAISTDWALSSIIDKFLTYILSIVFVCCLFFLFSFPFFFFFFFFF